MHHQYVSIATAKLDYSTTQPTELVHAKVDTIYFNQLHSNASPAQHSIVLSATLQILLNVLLAFLVEF